MLNRLFRLNESIGIGLQINYDNTVDIDGCKIVVKNNQLDFEKKIVGLKSIRELTSHFPLKSAISINLNGKGILHKQIEKTQEITPANFSQILPNANFKDFYIQNFVSASSSFVSIIRKEDADKWIKSFLDLHFIPINLSLGPFPVQIILPQLNNYGGPLIFNGHVIELNTEREWTAYRYDKTAVAPYPFKIENETIHENLLISYAAAFQRIFSEQTNTVEINVPSLNAAKQAIYSKKRTKILYTLLLIVPLLILMINALVFFHFKNANEKIASEINHSSFSLTDKEVIEEDIKNKEATLKRLFWDGGISKAFLLDQLAANIPAEITLKELSINPIDELHRNTDGKLLFSEREISVIGYCNRMYPVNDLISKLKDKEWVKTVQLVKYLYKPEESTGIFEILIKY